MLTIKQIHNHCSGAPCRKSSINRIHLLIQTRAISSLRKAISFIFCYNSVETRKDFTNLVNTVLGVEHEHAHLPGEEKRRADALAARKLRRSLLQVCVCVLHKNPKSHHSTIPSFHIQYTYEIPSLPRPSPHPPPSLDHHLIPLPHCM